MGDARFEVSRRSMCSFRKEYHGTIFFHGMLFREVSREANELITFLTPSRGSHLDGSGSRTQSMTRLKRVLAFLASLARVLTPASVASLNIC
jgi:hypothetical protein